MGRFLLLILLLPFLPIKVCSQNSNRPKIGLTLSGGGAKGLAHIGILKAIDSAGLKIDYITGTSMGSIIGSLYAVGYSAKQLEAIARKLDWDILLSNASSLRGLVMEEKEEYGKYDLELPWLNHSFHLPSGVLESEELWLKFSDLFFPVYNIKDFSKFSIPFKCIAVDIADGEALVLSDGEIVTAIRSSMAIPSVFTAVETKGRKLVDGGVVRNFPVKDVKQMGADIVIGSNVATGLLPKEKLNNAIQVLMQIAFFKEAEDTRKEIALCNIFIPIPMEGYTSASFNKSTDIIETGLEEGKKWYPIFKKLADSLDNLYGRQLVPAERLPKVDSIKITSIDVEGLKNTTDDFFIHMMGFYNNRYYTPEKLGKMVRKIFGTRYYKRVLYTLEPTDSSEARIHFQVEENPRTFAKVGLHYNKFTGIGIIANLTTRNFFTAHSRSFVTLNLGERFRVKGEHLQYLGRGKNLVALLGAQYEYLDIPTFTDYKKDGLYRQNYFQTTFRMQYSSSRSFTFGTGLRYELVNFKPTIVTPFQLKGKNRFLTNFLYWNINTLDKPVLPRRGVKMDSEIGQVYNQKPQVSIFINGQPVNQDSLGIKYNNYQRFLFTLENYFSVGKNGTIQTLFQTGINFNYDQNIFNDFVIGGLNRMFRNQIIFAGLEEGSFFTPSVSTLQLGYRMNVSNSIYATAKTNALVNNYISPDNRLQRPNFLSGHSLTMGYNFALGPLEISAMYNDQSRKFSTYINLGISF